MFQNYLIIAWQSLKKRPAYSSVKVLCLTLGLVCGILVLMHIQFVNSYDKHFSNYQNVYRLVASLYSNPVINAAYTPDPYGPQMALDYPEIEYVARAAPRGGLFGRDNNTSFNTIWWVEEDFTRIFTFEFLSGDSSGLDEVYSILIDETTAAKYFPGEDPLGQTLTFNQESDLIVAGVFRNLPANTHFDPQILASAETAKVIFGEEFLNGSDWGNFAGIRTYLTLPDKEAAQRLEADFADFIDRNMPDTRRDWAQTRQLTLYLEPLEEIHLSPRVGFSGGDSGRMTAIVFMGSMAALVLITSGINFANLFMTQVLQRNRELGVRKTLGAKRHQIIIQLLFESMLLVLLSLMLALPLVYFLVPVYTAMIGERFTFATLFETQYLISILLFLLLTAIFSGVVPALKASREDIVDTIKGGKVRSTFLARHGRSLISIIQFTCATTIIMMAIAVNLLVVHMLNRELGFSMENLLVMNSGYNAVDPEQFNYEAMKNQIGNLPGVMSLATASVMPPNIGGQNPWRVPGSDNNVGLPVRHIVVNENYLSTMELNLLAGRDFNPEFTTDFIPFAIEEEPQSPAEQGIRSVIITRDAAQDFGFGSPGQAVGQTMFQREYPYKVIGVVENFSFNGGLGDNVQNTQLMRATRDPLSAFLIRVDPLQADHIDSQVEEVWQRHRPDTPNNRYYFSQRYQLLVDVWGNAGTKTTLFAGVITLFISVCGLYALASYSSARRTKEIGVRKVLGAKSAAIVRLLTIDFIKPVVIACLISMVTGTLAINLLYGLFASYPDIPLWLYGVSIIGILLIAILTTVSQSIRTSRCDPVESLRYE